ncbi:MAG TPA: 50S ribosomal protein L25 [Candidatus Paceibacterota bacterium]|nr:50S ribosomal protein L25 [Candidatus Paceibacterota bacterium]
MSNYVRSPEGRQKITLTAEARAVVGKSLEQMRNQGVLPGVVYGHDFNTQSISVPLGDFQKAYQVAGESSLVYLDLAGEALPVLIHDVARDPVSDRFLHADFYKVNLKEKVEAEVPLVFTGEAPAVKELAGILVKNLNNIKVEALPQNLPHELIVDISKLASFTDHILLKDIVLPEGVELKEANPEEIVALVQEPISQEELDKELAAEATTTPEEVEVIKRPGAEVEEGVEPAPVAEPSPEEKK